MHTGNLMSKLEQIAVVRLQQQVRDIATKVFAGECRKVTRVSKAIQDKHKRVFKTVALSGDRNKWRRRDEIPASGREQQGEESAETGL